MRNKKTPFVVVVVVVVVLVVVVLFPCHWSGWLCRVFSQLSHRRRRRLWAFWSSGFHHTRERQHRHAQSVRQLEIRVTPNLRSHIHPNPLMR